MIHAIKNLPWSTSFLLYFLFLLDFTSNILVTQILVFFYLMIFIIMFIKEISDFKNCMSILVYTHFDESCWLLLD